MLKIISENNFPNLEKSVNEFMQYLIDNDKEVYQKIDFHIDEEYATAFIVYGRIMLE